MAGWCLDLDGRRDRDECAKPTIGRAMNLAYGNIAVFFMVRFQEAEMIKALQGKSMMKKLGRGGFCEEKWFRKTREKKGDGSAGDRRWDIGDREQREV